MPEAEQADSIKGTYSTDDIRKQDPVEKAAAGTIDKGELHKVEKLSKLGSAGHESAEGTE